MSIKWKLVGRWSMQSTCGRYRIAKTIGPRCVGCPSVAAYSAWVVGDLGWYMLDYYDSAQQAQQATEEHHDEHHTR